MGRYSVVRPQLGARGGLSCSEECLFRRGHIFLGWGPSVIVWFLSPPLLAWLSPALLGLFLSVPLSRASGSESLGRILSKLALLRTPDEGETPPLMARRRELVRQANPPPENGLRHPARNRGARLMHINRH